MTRRISFLFVISTFVIQKAEIHFRFWILFVEYLWGLNNSTHYDCRHVSRIKIYIEYPQRCFIMYVCQSVRHIDCQTCWKDSGFKKRFRSHMYRVLVQLQFRMKWSRHLRPEGPHVKQEFQGRGLNSVICPWSGKPSSDTVISTDSAYTDLVEGDQVNTVIFDRERNALCWESIDTFTGVSKRNQTVGTSKCSYGDYEEQRSTAAGHFRCFCGSRYNCRLSNDASR